MKRLYYVGLLMWFQASALEYALSDNQRIHSQSLGYDVQYRALAPTDASIIKASKIIFITDGQDYLHEAKFDQLILTMSQQKRIAPVIVIFIDSRDPDDLSVNRRNDQFMCNRDYANFYKNELILSVEQQYQLSAIPNNRLIMGFSFGALNAGCFGILLPETFGYLAMQSPASDQHVKILTKVYQETTMSAVNIFMTVGTRNDNTRAGRAFYRQLLQKGYNIKYHEVPYGHNWENWRSTLDKILLWFSPLNMN